MSVRPATKSSLSRTHRNSECACGMWTRAVVILLSTLQNVLAWFSRAQVAVLKPLRLHVSKPCRDISLSVNPYRTTGFLLVYLLTLLWSIVLFVWHKSRPYFSPTTKNSSCLGRIQFYIFSSSLPCVSTLLIHRINFLNFFLPYFKPE